MNSKTKVVKLSSIADVVAGQSPASTYYSTTEGTPFLQGNRTFGSKYPTIDTYTTQITKMAHKGDVLISVRAPIGDLNIANCDVCIGRGLASLNAKNGDNEFLYFLLKCNGKNLQNKKSGTTFEAISTDTLEDFDVIIPADEEQQKRISKVLSTIDNKIELNNKINKELEQMAKTLYDYWFVQFEFPAGIKGAYKSSNGPMTYNEVLKREIPVGWEVKNIKELAEMVWGQCPDGKNILPLDSKDENTLPYCSGAGDMPNCWCVSCQALTNNSRRKVEKGAILLSVAGTIGKMSISNRTISLGRATLGIIPHNPLYLSFLIWFIKSYTNRLQQISVGAVQKIINNASLEEMNFPFSKDLVNQYEYLNKITHLLIKNEEENVYLANLRDFLLPMLMNGQISVIQP